MEDGDPELPSRPPCTPWLCGRGPHPAGGKGGSLPESPRQSGGGWDPSTAPSLGTELDSVEPALNLIGGLFKKKRQNHKYRFPDASLPGPWKGPKQGRSSSSASWFSGPSPQAFWKGSHPLGEQADTTPVTRGQGYRVGWPHTAGSCWGRPWVPRQLSASPTQEQGQSGIWGLHQG